MTTAKDKSRHSQGAPVALYDQDFFAWTVRQSAALEARRISDIDWENLAEEIRGLGNNEKHEIESRLLVLLTHLLKWAFQPAQRKPGWAATIREQRRRIRRRIDQSRSLAGYPSEVLADEYGDARLNAADETGIDPDFFPERCPYAIEQVLDPDLWPDPARR